MWQVFTRASRRRRSLLDACVISSSTRRCKTSPRACQWATWTNARVLSTNTEHCHSLSNDTSVLIFNLSVLYKFTSQLYTAAKNETISCNFFYCSLRRCFYCNSSAVVSSSECKFYSWTCRLIEMLNCCQGLELQFVPLKGDLIFGIPCMHTLKHAKTIKSYYIAISSTVSYWLLYHTVLTLCSSH